MSIPTIVFDADDVLIPSTDFLAECASLALERPITVLAPRFGLTHRFGIADHEVPKVFDTFQARLEHQELYPGVADLLETLQTNGWRLKVVTAIPPSALDNRKKCFQRHGVSFSAVYASGAHGSKKQLLEQINPLAFFDDRLTNLAPLGQGSIRRVWVEHPLEEQCIPVDPTHFDDKTPSILHWFESNPDWLHPQKR